MDEEKLVALLEEICACIKINLRDLTARIPRYNGHSQVGAARAINNESRVQGIDPFSSPTLNDKKIVDKFERVQVSEMNSALHADMARFHLERQDLVSSLNSLCQAYYHLGGAEKRAFEIKEGARQLSVAAQRSVNIGKARLLSPKKELIRLIGLSKSDKGEKPEAGWRSIDEVVNALAPLISAFMGSDGECQASNRRQLQIWLKANNYSEDSFRPKASSVKKWLTNDSDVRAAFKCNAGVLALNRLSKM